MKRALLTLALVCALWPSQVAAQRLAATSRETPGAVGRVRTIHRLVSADAYSELRRAPLQRLKAKVQPHVEAGQMLGLTLVDIPAESMLRTLGFLPGDLITEVQAVALTSLPALASLRSLQAESTVKVLVVRRGRTLRFEFSVR